MYITYYKQQLSLVACQLELLNLTFKYNIYSTRSSTSQYWINPLSFPQFSHKILLILIPLALGGWGWEKDFTFIVLSYLCFRIKPDL